MKYGYGNGGAAGWAIIAAIVGGAILLGLAIALAGGAL